MQRTLTLLAGLLILKVTMNVVIGYRDYFPPDFASDFLRGRQSYFFGAYQWAFYAHVVSGPLTLIFGLILVSEQFRSRYPKWHRVLGKSQALIVLCMLAPSGLWMARYAETGAIAGMGFALLAIVTGACVLLGWRSAVKKRFAEHRRWMWRCYLLLCSAVVLRLIGGLAIVTDAGGSWIYPLAAWASWFVPLAAFEIGSTVHRLLTQSNVLGESHSANPVSNLSLPALDISARR